MDMDTLAEAVVATFDSHPEVEWHQLFSTEPAATFEVEGDTVLVYFQMTDADAWRVSFEVEKTAKTTTQLLVNSVRILSGAFQAVRKFLEDRKPKRLVLDTEPLGTLFQTYLEKAGTKLFEMGYRAVSVMERTALERS